MLHLLCFLSLLFWKKEKKKKKISNCFHWMLMDLKLETCSSRSCCRFLFLLSAFTLLLFTIFPSVTSSVTYDRKAIIVNGRRRILISGSIHYPRSTPEVFECGCEIFLGNVGCGLSLVFFISFLFIFLTL